MMQLLQGLMATVSAAWVVGAITGTITNPVFSATAQTLDAIAGR